MVQSMNMKKTGVEWWHEDPEGRRIGYMWPEDFESILTVYYGKTRWVAKFGHMADISRGQIGRYRTGIAPIPKPVAMMM